MLCSRRPPTFLLFVRALHSKAKPKKPFQQNKPVRPTPRSSQNIPLEEPNELLQKVSSQNDGNRANGISLSEALRDSNDQDSTLRAPVHISEEPSSILRENHPASSILANSAIIVQRQLELANVLLGFEQANKYIIMDPNGNHIGYMAERDLGFGSTIARQWFKTHRSFTTHVFDKYQKEVLRFHRPFAWISSRIRVYDPLETAVSSIEASNSASLANIDNQSAQTSSLELSNMRVIGEAQQQWAPLRRKYNLFIFQESPKDTDLGSGPVSAQDLQLSESQNLQVANQAGGGEYGQFAYVDEPFLSWDFSLFSADSRLIGSVNRNFAGLAKELFTDMGTYALRMDAAGLAEEPKHMISQTACKSTALAPTIGMSLDQRAVMLCTAVSIDFDYFSRHSSGGGLGFMPLWFPGMGGEAAAGGAAAEAGAAEGAGAIGTVGRGVGVREGAAAGAGTMAGYEAMQRGGAPQPDESLPDPSTQEPSNYGQGEEVWGERSSPPGDSQGGVGGSQGSGDEGGGGWSDLLDDFFDE